jgi:hypothetical protein
VAGRESDQVLLDGYLISYFQTGLKNLLDRAILDSSDFHANATVEKYGKLDELPFDFTRRMMSVLVQGSCRTLDPPHQGRTRGDLSALLAIRARRQAVENGPGSGRRIEARVRQPER